MTLRDKRIAAIDLLIAAATLAAVFLPASPSYAEHGVPPPVTIRFGYTTFEGPGALENNPSFNSVVSYLDYLRETRPGGSQRWNFHVSTGNYYQIYNWLEHRSLDAALVSPFSAMLLARNGIAVPLVEFVVRDENPESDRPGHTPVVGFSDETSAGAREALMEHLGAVLEAARTAGDSWRAEGLQYRIDWVSHLSTSGLAVPLVFIENWLRDQGEARDSAAANRFWRILFEQSQMSLHHGLSGNGPKRIVFSYVNEDRIQWEPYANVDLRIPDDVLVVRPEMMKALFEGTSPAAPPSWLIPDTASQRYFRRGDYIRVQQVNHGLHDEFQASVSRVLGSDGGDGYLRNLYHGWYELGGYDFTVLEILDFLRLDQQTTGRGQLALVLPGGGVKSIYQAEILDELYGECYLANEGAEECKPHLHGPRRGDSRPAALTVNEIVGTSGGAIVGLFAAARREKTVTVSDLAERAATGRLFSLLGVLRWATVVWVLFILLLTVNLVPVLARAVIHAAGRLPALPGRGRLIRCLASLRPTYSTARSKRGISLRYKMWVPAFVLVLMPPLLARWTRARYSEADSPWEGAMYSVTVLFLALALSTSVRRPRGGFKIDRGMKAHAAALISLGCLFIALAALGILAFPEVAQDFSGTGTGMTPCSWLGSIGAMALAIGWFAHLLCGSRRAMIERPRSFWRALLLTAIYLVAVYVVILVKGGGLTSALLELNPRFWWELTVVGLVFSLVIVVSSWRKRFFGGFFHGGVAALLGADRPSRVSPLATAWLVAVVSVLAWLTIASPAIYGNQLAVAAFDKSSEGLERLDVSLVTTGAILRSVECDDSDRRLVEGDVYFCFSDGLPCVRPEDEQWFSSQGAFSPLGEEPRLRDAVFASGSPFPIFPPHAVRFSGECRVPIIDGGYAHNVPLEAALRAGARQVLLVHSTPETRVGGESKLFQAVSPFVRHAWRLIPLLFAQAQELDESLKMNLFVASLRPDPQDDFPWLADFHPAVVKRLRDYARRDVGNNRRLGRIEGWGEPIVVHRVESP